MHASRLYPANSVLGVYRSLTMLPAEELVLRHNPPADYPHSTVNWRQAIDAYAAGKGSWWRSVIARHPMNHPGGWGRGEGAGNCSLAELAQLRGVGKRLGPGNLQQVFNSPSA